MVNFPSNRLKVAGAAAALLLVLAPVAETLGQGATPAPNTPVPKEKRQSPPAPGDKSDKGAAKRPTIRIPGASIPQDPALRARLLRDLYALLGTAEDQQSAEAVASAIERVWQAGIGDTARVLMERASKAASEERPDLALRLLDAVASIAPDQPEVFNRRAYVYYSLNEFGRAMADLRQALALDPSHYKALEGLAQLLRETKQSKAALDVYRRLIAVHPYSSGAKTVVEELERTVGGQGT
jgi:tetratricopeptide (TPR) repeat protein